MTGMKYNISMTKVTSLNFPTQSTITFNHHHYQTAELVSGAITTYKILYCPTLEVAVPLYNLLFVHPCLMDQISPGIF
jgi:hypothetical protein